MKLKVQTLALALEALKEKETELRRRWIAEENQQDAEVLNIRKNAYMEARINLEVNLHMQEVEVETV